MAHRLLIIALFLFVSPSVSAAADPPGGTRSVRHRVTGLFSPDREADLRRLMVEKLPEIKLVSVDFATSEATFDYDADKLFNRPTPEQLVERFDNLLRSHSQSTFGIRALCAKPREKLQFVEIPVVGLDCKGCCLAAYEAIYRLDGVEQATASFKEGLVTARIDPEKTDRGKLEAALRARNVQLRTLP